MDSELQAEMNQDLYDMSQVSDINLDNGSTSGDLGLGQNYAVKMLYSDFILVEMIDMNKGFVTTKSGLKIPDTKVKSWRRGRVHLIGPLVEKYGMTKVGDIVSFPNDKGLTCGKVSYIKEVENGESEVIEIDNAVILDERRLMMTLEEVEEITD